MSRPNMISLHINLITLAILLLAGNVLAGPGGAAETLTYEAFLEQVSIQHPDNDINAQRESGAVESVNRVGRLPDPQLTLRRDQVRLPDRYQTAAQGQNMTGSDSMAEDSDSRSASREVQPVWALGLSQTFPWPGTLAAEERAARAQSQNVSVETSLVRLRNHFDAAALFLKMVRTSKTLDVQRANLKVVESVKNYAHAKFKQGIGSHLEFLQTHSESGVLRANIAALETDLRNLKQHALLLIKRSEFDKVATAPQFHLEWPRLTVPTANLPADDLIKEQLLREKASAVARSAVAYRRTLPSLTLSGSVMQEDSGMRMGGGMLGIGIPLYSIGQRRSLNRDEALTIGRIDAQLSWYERQKALALRQAEDRIHQIQANSKILQNEIIPPVKEHMDAATAQFSQGKADIATVIEGRRTLLGLEITAIKLAEEQALAQLSLEKIRSGFAESELDRDMPQLSGVGGSGMGGDSGAMSSMPKREKGSMQKLDASPGAASIGEDQEPDSSSKSSGMGM